MVRTPAKPSVRIIRVEDWRFLVEEREGILRELELGWPAGGATYFLDAAELTYLVFKDVAEAYLGDSRLDLTSIYSTFPQMSYAWSKFTVLLDLRDRGRRARSGYSPRELLYTKGSQRVLVLVLEENTLVRASEVAEWVRSALMREYRPIIAVVDAHGDVTYYSASVVRASDLGRVYAGEDTPGTG